MAKGFTIANLSITSFLCVLLVVETGCLRQLFSFSMMTPRCKNFKAMDNLLSVSEGSYKISCRKIPGCKSRAMYLWEVSC